jgi:hypothetical protein
MQNLFDKKTRPVRPRPGEVDTSKNMLGNRNLDTIFVFCFPVPEPKSAHQFNKKGAKMNSEDKRAKFKEQKTKSGADINGIALSKISSSKIDSMHSNRITSSSPSDDSYDSQGDGSLDVDSEIEDRMLNLNYISA